MASWWFDATGAPGLVGTLDGSKLPLTNPTQSDASFAQATCRVFSEGKEVGSFKAELATSERARNAAASLAKDPAEGKFTVAGGAGSVEPNSGDVGRAWWTCKSTILQVELLKPKDKDSRDALVKNLAQHVAEVAGCPGPEPKAG
jgi:hypothetical protein